jgi:hypothetical protein
MPGVSQRCHELRIVDREKTWRIIYRINEDAFVIANVFRKTRSADAEEGDQRLPVET